MQQTYSNSEASYPVIEQAFTNGWPWWKARLSMPETYYELGFTYVDEDVYKRIDDNGLALYVDAPSTGTDLLRLKACYVNHRLKHTHHTVRSVHKAVPVVARLLLQGADNSTIVIAMED